MASLVSGPVSGACKPVANMGPGPGASLEGDERNPAKTAAGAAVGRLGGERSDLCPAPRASEGSHGAPPLVRATFVDGWVSEP